MYSVKYDKTVIKFLAKQEKLFAKKVLDAMDEIAQNPFQNHYDVKPLTNRANHFRLRIGKYRILYEMFETELLIYCYDADSRGGIYK